MSPCDGERDRARKQIAVAARLHHGVRAVDADQHRPDETIVESGSELDLVCPRLAPDLCTPGLAVVDVVDLVNHVAGCQQMPIVVAPLDAREEAVDSSPDINRIVHDLFEIVGPRFALWHAQLPSEGAAEKTGKGRRERSG